MTFEEYLKAQGKSNSTVQYYQYCLADFKKWLKPQNMDPEAATGPDIMGYLEELKTRGQNGQSRGVRLTAINHWFDYLLQQEIRSHHPAHHIKLRGKPQNKLYPLLKRPQLESIYLDYVVPQQDDPRSNRNWFRTTRLGKHRNKVILGMLVYQGLTTTEVNRLLVKDLDLRAGTIHVRGSRKSNARTLELKPGQIMDLMEYQLQVRPEILTWYAQPVEELFVALPVAGMQAAVNGGNIWKRLSAEVREKHKAFINFNQVRTSVIVSWLGTHNLRRVQYMAGHRYVSSTEKYYLHHIEDLQADIDRFHPLG